MAKIKGINPDGKVVEVDTDEWVKEQEAKEQETEENEKKKSVGGSFDKRSRRFCLISYIKSEALENFVSTLPWVQHWAMITHDKDLEKDGTPKKVHTHILLYTYEAKTSSAVRKIFDRYSQQVYKDTDTPPQNTLVKIMYDPVSQWRYLIHADDPDKAQYSRFNRICDNHEYWRKLESSAGLTDHGKNIALAILQDMANGEKQITMCERYGQNYVINKKHYKAMLAEISNDELQVKVSQGEGFKITEFFPMILHNAPFQKGTLNAFYMVLDYIRKECMMSYDGRMEIYLNTNYTNNDLKIGELKNDT